MNRVDSMKRFALIACLTLMLAGVSATGIPVVEAAPSTEGEWTPVTSWPQWAIHAHVLPTGKVLFWATDKAGPAVYFWDPQTETVTLTSGRDYQIFCAGHSFLPDGRLLVTGGALGSAKGFTLASIYDPFAESWVSVPPPNGGRYYPSSTTLANGDILIISGNDEDANLNPLPQVYQVELNSWRDLTDAQLTIPYYPRPFLAPNGKVFVATMPSRYLDTTGTGSWSVVDMPLIQHTLPNIAGSAVMYDDGKILWAG